MDGGLLVGGGGRIKCNESRTKPRKLTNDQPHRRATIERKEQGAQTHHSLMLLRGKMSHLDLSLPSFLKAASNCLDWISIGFDRVLVFGVGFSACFFVVR